MANSRFPKTTAGPEHALRWLPRLATIGLVALGAWLATEWFWYFVGSTGKPPASATQQRARIDLQASAEAIASTRLFGAEKQATVTAQVSNLNIKLKGVFAGRPDRPAFAIVNTGSRDDFALAGREVMPGVKLESVHPDHVIVVRNGVLERVNLEERAGGAGGGIGRPAGAPMMTTPPPRQRPNVPAAAVNSGAAGRTQQMMQNFGKVAMGAGGLTVEAAPAGSMLASVGLQPGDVIQSVNGQVITSEAEIARIYQQNMGKAAVQAQILRNGQTIPLDIPLNR